MEMMQSWASEWHFQHHIQFRYYSQLNSACMCLFNFYTLAYEHSILGLRLDTIFIHSKLVMNIHTHNQTIRLI